MKKFTTLLVALTVLLTPALARADFKEYLPSFEGLFNSLLGGVIGAVSTFFSKLWETLNNTIIPHDPYLGLALIGLTMVWLLGIPSIRKVVGRLSGPALAIFLGIASYKAIIAVISGLSAGVAFLLLILLVILTRIMLTPLKMLGGWLWSLFKSTLHGTEVSTSGCAAGAFLVAGIINGKWISTEANSYIPSYVSSGIGVIVGSYLLYDYWKNHRSPRPETRPQPQAEPQPERQPVATVVPETSYREPAQPPVTVMERPRTRQEVECPKCHRQTPVGNYCNTCGGSLAQPTSQTQPERPTSAHHSKSSNASHRPKAPTHGSKVTYQRKHRIL